MIRILCLECDIGAAANIGGPVQTKGKTFTIDCPELERWLGINGDEAKWTKRCVVGVEILPEDVPED